MQKNIEIEWRHVKKDNTRHRLSGKTICIITVAALLQLTVMVFVTGYVALNYISSDDVPVVPSASVEAEEVPALDPSLEILEEEPDDITEDIDGPIPEDTQRLPIYQQDKIEDNIINILLIGDDSRSCETGSGRSDTMMLFSYDFKNNNVSLISFMRDIWVPIEGYGYNRLNSTYAWGGAGLAINTINLLFGLDIQNYVIVDFESASKLVDKLGGVEVNITEVEAKYYNQRYGWGIEKGVNELDGEMALLHARNRVSDGADFERTRRQRDIMLALYKKIISSGDAGMLLDFVGYSMNNVKTNMLPEEIFSLATMIFNNHEQLCINQGRVPYDGTWAYANKDGMSVLAIDFDKNKEYIHDELYMD